MEQVLEIIAIILSVFTGGSAGTMAMWLNKKNKNIKEQNVILQKENENIKSELKTINKEIANIQNINNIYITEFNELKNEIQSLILSKTLDEIKKIINMTIWKLILCKIMILL